MLCFVLVRGPYALVVVLVAVEKQVDALLKHEFLDPIRSVEPGSQPLLVRGSVAVLSFGKWSKMVKMTSNDSKNKVK